MGSGRLVDPQVSGPGGQVGPGWLVDPYRRRWGEGGEGESAGAPRMPACLPPSPHQQGQRERTCVWMRVTVATGVRCQPPSPTRPPPRKGTVGSPCDVRGLSSTPRLSPIPCPSRRVRARSREAEEGKAA